MHFKYLRSYLDVSRNANIPLVVEQHFKKIQLVARDASTEFFDMPMRPSAEN